MQFGEENYKRIGIMTKEQEDKIIARQRLLQEQAVNLMAMVFGVNFAKISILQNIYIVAVELDLIKV